MTDKRKDIEEFLVENNIAIYERLCGVEDKLAKRKTTGDSWNGVL